MKRLHEKVEKSSLVVVALLLLTLAWFFGLIIIGVLSGAFPAKEGIAAGVIGATGSIIGGLFTLVGVKWTIRKQEIDKFWEDYPERLSHLLVINKILWDIRRDFSELLMLKNDDHEGRGIYEEAVIKKLEDLYIRASKVDAYTFGKINLLEEEVRSSLFDLSSAKLQNMDLKSLEITENIREKIQKCSELVSEHKKSLSQLLSARIKKGEVEMPQ